MPIFPALPARHAAAVLLGTLFAFAGLADAASPAANPVSSPAAPSAPAAAAEAKPGTDLEIFNGATHAPYIMYLGSPTNWANPVPEKGNLNIGSIKAEITQVNTPGDGKKVTWNGGIGQMYAQAKSTLDLSDYLDDDSALVFDAVVHSKPEDSVTIRVDCRYPCLGIIEAAAIFKSLPLNEKTTIKIPLSCFAKTGAKFTSVNTPFLFYSTARFSMSFANMRWVRGAAKDADARSTCS